MSHFEPRVSVNPPFKVDLCCNINIEIHVAMRLGELIKASKTEDKQLMALGYRLSHAMTHLVDQLDNRQFDRLSQYMEEQAEDSYESNDSDSSYVAKARGSFSNPMDYDKSPMEMKHFVSAVVSKKD